MKRNLQVSIKWNSEKTGKYWKIFLIYVRSFPFIFLSYPPFDTKLSRTQFMRDVFFIPKIKLQLLNLRFTIKIIIWSYCEICWLKKLWSLMKINYEKTVLKVLNFSDSFFNCIDWNTLCTYFKESGTNIGNKVCQKLLLIW